MCVLQFRKILFYFNQKEHCKSVSYGLTLSTSIIDIRNSKQNVSYTSPDRGRGCAGRPAGDKAMLKMRCQNNFCSNFHFVMQNSFIICLKTTTILQDP